ncbi:MAG: DUF11 domain-containing protein [Marinicaulis sp.]|nr:DUF11 domain-containing protein [Marinicaulis sp.]
MTPRLMIAMCALLAAAPAWAEISAEQRIEKEIVEKGPNGEVRLARVAADTVQPGEEVIYSLSYSNKAADAAEAVVLVIPVPDEITYVEGSATGENLNILFSADGGETFVARGRLTVVEDGRPRAAKGDEITHIKWTLASALKPSQAGEVSFRGILK